MLLVVLAALAASTPSDTATPSASSPTAPAAAAAPASSKKSDMVCKTEEVTGSRFPKKVCYSKAEAEERQRLEQEQLRQNQSGGLIRGH